MVSGNLYLTAHACLMEADPARKAAMTREAAEAWAAGRLRRTDAPGPEPVADAGRPEKPALVAPRDLARRSMSTPEGRIVLAHALAHIEFNAINIGWDAVYRFRDMPDAFYGDWIRVAREEADHFELLQHYLYQRGHDYGDFPAHDGLWEMVRRTDDDVLIRMALVPRVLEARGLDVTPGMQVKLREAGDEELVAILDVIYREEIGHVKIGSRWFNYLCQQRGLPPRETFRDLLNRYMQGRIRGPYDELGRMQAGFSAEEIEDLKALESEWFA